MKLTPDYLLENEFIEQSVLVVPGDDVRCFSKVVPFDGTITVYIRNISLIPSITSKVRLTDRLGNIYFISSLDTDEINKDLEELGWKFRF